MHKILVIDDDGDNLLLTRTILERAGFEVVATIDPAQAPALAAAGDLDAVVLDLMMPGLSGIDVLRGLRSHARTRSLPILFLSSRAEAPDRVRGLREGADDYLGKPYDPAELVLRVQRLVVASPTPHDSLEGRLEHFPLSEVVQTLQQGRKSGFLAVVAGEGVGRLVLRNGEIRAASFARLTGRDALQAMLDRPRGRFRFNAREGEGPSPAAESEALDLEAALLEAAWIDDELSLRRAHLPGIGEPLIVVDGGPPEAPRNLPSLPIRQIHVRVRTHPGVTLGGLMSHPWAAPNRIRLATVWLVEQGVLRVAAVPREPAGALA
jgi:CheY-like chemotaxis protein